MSRRTLVALTAASTTDRADAMTLILKAIDLLGAEQISAQVRRQPEILGATDTARSRLIAARDALHEARHLSPRCLWCGRPMTSRRRKTCSDRCRVYRSRAGKASA